MMTKEADNQAVRFTRTSGPTSEHVVSQAKRMSFSMVLARVLGLAVESHSSYRELDHRDFRLVHNTPATPIMPVTVLPMLGHPIKALG
jgi:hypothetical protein